MWAHMNVMFTFVSVARWRFEKEKENIGDEDTN